MDREAAKVVLWLDFEKLHPEATDRVGPIVRPGHLLTILLPPLVLVRMLRSGRPDRRDLRLDASGQPAASRGGT